MRRFAAGFLLGVLCAVLRAQAASALDEDDRTFLLQVQKDSASYFWEQANTKNGLIRDNTDAYSPCSIAAVGFGLVALCVMDKNGWVPREAVEKRIVRTLRTLRDKVEHVNGFFYHFVNMENGKREWKSEVSSMDTALAVAGALFAGEYFKDGNPQIKDLADRIYQRVQWPWLLNSKHLMRMGYKPESGMLPYSWDTFNEGLLLYALAIGSGTHPIGPECWHAWKRPMIKSKAGTMVYCETGSLFVYQYPQAFLDLRNLHDGAINYWRNAVKATLANRFFCVQNRPHFRTYDEHVWGLTACLGPDGYKGYGAEPANNPLHDGTVAPSAVAGSLPFTPKLATATLKAMFSRYGSRIYGPHGFYDAFNVDRNWWARSYIGIDQGISVLMIENLLSRTVWSCFMKLPAIKTWAGACMKQAVRGQTQSLEDLNSQERRLPLPVVTLTEWNQNTKRWDTACLAPTAPTRKPGTTLHRRTLKALVALAEWGEIGSCQASHSMLPPAMGCSPREELDTLSRERSERQTLPCVMGVAVWEDRHPGPHNLCVPSS